MTFAVVVAIPPDAPRDQRQGAWPAFLSRANGQPPRTGTAQHPSENVWLLTLPADTPLLGRIVQLAQEQGVEHHVLYFDSPPQVFHAPGSSQ